MWLTPLGLRSLAAAPATPTGKQDAREETAPDTVVAPRRPQRKASTYEHGLKDLKDMAKNDPGMVAMIVRNWMKRDGQ
jgi:flagellar M-ring protein FliF